MCPMYVLHLDYSRRCVSRIGTFRCCKSFRVHVQNHQFTSPLPPKHGVYHPASVTVRDEISDEVAFRLVLVCLLGRDDSFSSRCCLLASVPDCLSACQRVRWIACFVHRSSALAAPVCCFCDIISCVCLCLLLSLGSDQHLEALQGQKSMPQR